MERWLIGDGDRELYFLATNTCAIHIDIIAPDDKAAGYDLWQAAVALDGLCARKGRTGKSRFLCKLRRIFLMLLHIFLYFDGFGGVRWLINE